VPDSKLVRRLRAAGCVFAEDEAALLAAAASSPAELEAMAGRRCAGYPIEQVVGWAEFCAQRIEVDPGVFVPRRRTEFLVRQARRLTATRPGEARTIVVADVCCGSGALGVAVAAGRRDVELHATDLEPAAVQCARRNVEPIGGSVYQGDLFEALPDLLRGRIDVILANAPYVPTSEIGLLPAEAREHELLTSLDGGADGLAVLRRVIAEAAGWLADGGAVLMETTEAQLPALRRAVEEAALLPRTARSSSLAATVVIATATAR
jgi:release factor glutamine methyltransferase